MIDLTPGSGAPARACVESSIPYVGVTKKQVHASWLINVVNRAAVELITRNGSSLYEQDLANCIKDHFKELLEELNDCDEALSDDEDTE